MNAQSTTQMTRYLGLTVDVIQILKHCSLIRFGGRDFIVDTADLVIVNVIKRAA